MHRKRLFRQGITGHPDVYRGIVLPPAARENACIPVGSNVYGAGLNGCRYALSKHLH